MWHRNSFSFRFEKLHSDSRGIPTSTSFNYYSISTKIAINYVAYLILSIRLSNCYKHIDCLLHRWMLLPTLFRFFLLNVPYFLNSKKRLQKQHSQIIIDCERMSGGQQQQFWCNTNDSSKKSKWTQTSWYRKILIVFNISRDYFVFMKGAREKGHFDWKQTPLFMRLRCNQLIWVVRK